MFLSFRANASRLHKEVGECLKEAPFFKLHEVQQEYHIKNISPKAPYNFFYDWAIPSLSLVIECHGKQHYRPVAFSNDYEQAIVEYRKTQAHDKIKQSCAEDAGWVYLVVPYTDEGKVTEAYLLAAYESLISSAERIRYNKPKKAKDPKHLEYLEKQRLYRKEQYKRAKERKRSVG